MGAEMVELRLLRSDRCRELRRWSESVDTRDGKAMRAALVGAIKSEIGEGADWETALPFHELGWRRGPAMSWRTFRVSR